jgi:hypothetical protein
MHLTSPLTSHQCRTSPRMPPATGAPPPRRTAAALGQTSGPAPRCHRHYLAWCVPQGSPVLYLSPSRHLASWAATDGRALARARGAVTNPWPHARHAYRLWPAKAIWAVGPIGQGHGPVEAQHCFPHFKFFSDLRIPEIPIRF